MRVGETTCGQNPRFHQISLCILIYLKYSLNWASVGQWLASCWAFLVAEMVKKSACNVGDPGLIPGSARSLGEGNGYPLQYSCLEELHGKRSLAGYGSQMDSSKWLVNARHLSFNNMLPFYLKKKSMSDSPSSFSGNHTYAKPICLDEEFMLAWQVAGGALPGKK